MRSNRRSDRASTNRAFASLIGFRPWPVSLLAIVIVSLVLGAPTLAVAEGWPTTRFEIHEGEPGGLLELKSEASVPLTDELRTDMEAMLYSVATELERQGFPPPMYDPPNQIDGNPFWRVYYYDFEDGDKTIAVYSSTCGAGRAFIHINAAKFTDNGRPTAKSYGDLAHELFHAVQAGSVMGKENCKDPVGDWIEEGQAEAFGHDMARRYRGTEVDNFITRWGLRGYDLNLSAAGTSSQDDREQAYQTSSLWRYLAERHHLRKRGKSGANALPGPDLPSGYDTDYSYLVSILDQPISRVSRKGELDWLDVGLEVEFDQGLKPIFTDFIAVYADYGLHRVKANASDSARQRGWLEASFANLGQGTQGGQCTKVQIDATQQQDVKMRLRLEPATADCVEIETGAMPGPTSWIVQTTSPSDKLTRQLGLALSGGQQTLKAAPIDTGTTNRPPALWGFVFEPNKTYYLLITNLAEIPSQTEAQDIEVRISLPSHQANTTPKPRPVPGGARRPPEEPPRPGPAGSKAESQRLEAAAQIGPSGPGAVNWHHEEGGYCDSGSRFDCLGGVEIDLGLAPSGPSVLSAMGASGFNDLVSFSMEYATTLFEMEAMEANMEVPPGANVTLRIPGADYGFTGSVSDAYVSVSAGDNEPAWYAMSSEPLTAWSPCNYGPPNGTVTIEEFSRTLIRGSFQAQLVVGGGVTRLGYRERCPRRQQAGTVQGRFVIAAPWFYDNRHDPDYSWVMEDAMLGIGSRLPAGMNLPMSIPDAPSASPPGGPGATSNAGIGDLMEAMGESELPESDQCDCSCEEFRRIMRLADGMDDTGDSAEQQAELMSLGMCAMQCASAYATCPQ